METTTARVDLQKLQILSDRIAQTLEALNQVRITAHSVAVEPNYWNTRPEFRNPYASYGIGMNPYFSGSYQNQGLQPSQAFNPWSQHPVNLFGMGHIQQPTPFQNTGFHSHPMNNAQMAYAPQYGQAPIW